MFPWKPIHWFPCLMTLEAINTHWHPLTYWWRPPGLFLCFLVHLFEDICVLETLGQPWTDDKRPLVKHGGFQGHDQQVPQTREWCHTCKTWLKHGKQYHTPAMTGNSNHTAYLWIYTTHDWEWFIPFIPPIKMDFLVSWGMVSMF